MLNRTETNVSKLQVASWLTAVVVTLMPAQGFAQEWIPYYWGYHQTPAMYFGTPVATGTAPSTTLPAMTSPVTTSAPTATPANALPTAPSQPRPGTGAVTSPATTAATAATTVSPQAAPPGPDFSKDIYQICWYLNYYRGFSGLPPVKWDANLARSAASNNGMQRAYGLGHFDMSHGGGQNSAQGSLTVPGVVNMWLGSPGHAAAIYTPYSRVGLAFDGMFWTLNLSY